MNIHIFFIFHGGCRQSRHRAIRGSASCALHKKRQTVFYAYGATPIPATDGTKGRRPHKLHRNLCRGTTIVILRRVFTVIPSLDFTVIPKLISLSFPHLVFFVIPQLDPLSFPCLTRESALWG